MSHDLPNSPGPERRTIRGNRRASDRQLPPTRMGGDSTPRSPAPETVALPERVSRFEVAEEIGRGGMGQVRSARDPALDRVVAVKTLLNAGDPGAVARFEREAQITGQLEHPNIVPVHEMGRDSRGRPWLAMKRVHGETLRTRIEEWNATRPRGRLRAEELAERLHIFTRVCDAVGFAHSRGVIHRDLKPDNVMLGDHGEVLVVDWGLARAMRTRTPPVSVDRGPSSRQSGASAANTLDGAVLGTPAYMPPEQASGHVEQLDQRSDIFSLGGILYHLLTGSPPYVGDNAITTLTQAVRYRLEPPRRRAPSSGIPMELQAIVLKAMARVPDSRYARVSDLQDDLAAWQSFRSTTAWRGGVGSRVGKWTRRHPTSTAMAVLTIVAGLAVAVLLSQMQAIDAERRLAREAADRRKQELQAEEVQRQLAEARAEAERARAEVQQSRAEAAEQRVVMLGDRLTSQLDAESQRQVREFDRLWDAARDAGRADEFAASLTPEQIAGFLRAFNALFEVHELLDTTPDYRHYMARGLILGTIGDNAGAIADYSNVINSGVRDDRAFYNRAVAYVANNQPAEAVADYTTALAINPQHRYAHFNRGIAYQLLGDLENALADYSAAIRQNPGHKRAHVNRGAVYREQGRLEDAIREFDAALAIDPAFSPAWFNRGSTHDALGRIDESISDFSHCLESDPDNLDAIAMRGLLLLNANRPGEALRDFDAALAIDHRVWQFHANRGIALTDLGRNREAIDALIEARAMCPDPTTRARLADSIRQSGGTVPE